MSDPLIFSVKGRPIPTARPRVLKSGRTFMPTRTTNAQILVGEAALQACSGKRPFFPEGALSVWISACFAWPKGTAKKRILPGWTSMTQQPDVDNLAKTVLDDCNTVVWADDNQIASLTIRKFRVENPDDEGFHVEIWRD